MNSILRLWKLLALDPFRLLSFLCLSSLAAGGRFRLCEVSATNLALCFRSSKMNTTYIESIKASYFPMGGRLFAMFPFGCHCDVLRARVGEVLAKAVDLFEGENKFFFKVNE
jgi:hypothetical protein